MAVLATAATVSVTLEVVVPALVVGAGAAADCDCSPGEVRIVRGAAPASPTTPSGVAVVSPGRIPCTAPVTFGRAEACPAAARKVTGETLGAC